MATFRKTIGPAGLLPDNTGRVYLEPYTVKATNDKFGHPVLVLNDPSSGQEHGAFGMFRVPKNYVANPKIGIVWTSTAIAGNARYAFRYRSISGDDTNSLDQATYEESVLITDAAPGAPHRRLEALLNLTAANLAADETIEFFFARLDDSGADTMAAAGLVHELFFEYTDA